MKKAYEISQNVTEYIKTEEFRQLLKIEINNLFKKKHKHDLNKISLVLKKELFNYKKIFNSWDTSSQEHNEYASFIGYWSEYFFIYLKEINWDSIDKNKIVFFKKKTKNKDLTLDDLSAFDNPIDNAIFKSIDRYRSETFKHYRNRKLDKNPFSEDYLFIKGWPTKLLNKDILFFEKIIKHFIINVFPHVKKLKQVCDPSDFTEELFKKYKTLMEWDWSKIFCSVQGWKFDAFDFETEYLVEFKFCKKRWSNNWIYQLIVYTYLLNKSCPKLKINGIKIINTSLGEEWSISLNDLFGKNGLKQLVDICTYSIPNAEKKELSQKLRIAYNYWLENNKQLNPRYIKTWITKYKNDELMLKKIEDFMLYKFNTINNEHDLKDGTQIWLDWCLFQNK